MERLRALFPPKPTLTEKNLLDQAGKVGTRFKLAGLFNNGYHRSSSSLAPLLELASSSLAYYISIMPLSISPLVP